MKFYLSYWTNRNTNDASQSALSVGGHISYFNLPRSWIPLGANEEELQNIKKEYDFMLKKKLTSSVVSAIKKNYNEVYLITDYEGEKIFKNFGFTKIFTDLEDLPKQYSDIWCLGKLKAYNILSKFGDPFFHVDYDFVINNKLPENVEKVEILTQSKEFRLFDLRYCLETINSALPKKYLYDIHKPNLAYNMGIFGGNDLEFFWNYSSSALNVVFDPINKPFWLTPYNQFDCFTFWSKSTFIEQYYFAICLEFYNKKSKCLYELLAPEYMDKNGEYILNRLPIYHKMKILHLHGNMKSDINLLKWMFPGEGYELFN